MKKKSFSVIIVMIIALQALVFTEGIGSNFDYVVENGNLETETAFDMDTYYMLSEDDGFIDDDEAILSEEFIDEESFLAEEEFVMENVDELTDESDSIIDDGEVFEEEIETFDPVITGEVMPDEVAIGDELSGDIDLVTSVEDWPEYVEQVGETDEDIVKSVDGLEGLAELAKNDEVEFTITGAGEDITEPKDGDVKWIVADVPTVDSTKLEVARVEDEDSFVLIAKEDIKTDESIAMTIPMKKQVYDETTFEWKDANPEETQDYTYNFTLKGHIPVEADVNDCVIDGIEGETFKLIEGKGYKFTVYGAGSDNENPGEGDTRFVPLNYKLWNWDAVDLTSRKSNPSIADGELVAESTIRKEYDLDLEIQFQKQTYTDGKWVDNKGEKESVKKTGYVTTDELPIEKARYSIISEKTGSVDYDTSIPSSQLVIKSEDESIVTAEIKNKKVTFEGVKAGTADVIVYWKSSDGKEYALTTYTINVKDVITVYKSENEEWEEIIEVPEGAEITISSSNKKLVTASAGKIEKKSCTISFRIAELERDENGRVTSDTKKKYSLVTIKNKKTDTVLKEYYVRVNLRQDVTLKEGQSTNTISFTSKTEPDISLESDDPKIAKATNLKVEEKVDASGNKTYTVSFNLTGVSKGGPVKIVLANKGIPQRSYFVTVTKVVTPTLTPAPIPTPTPAPTPTPVGFGFTQPKLIAAYNGSNGIGIKFYTLPNATDYIIYRKFNGIWSAIKTVSVTSPELQGNEKQVMYTDTTVKNDYGKGYIYSVAGKKGSSVTNFDQVGKAIYRLKPPALAKAANSAAGTATVNWKGVFGRTETNGNYDLQYTEYANGKAGPFKSVTKLPGYNNLTLSAKVGGLKKGKKYVFRIRCSKTNKDRGTFYSEYSPWLSVTITK